MRRGAEMRIDVVKLSTSPVADWSVSKTAAEFSTAAWLEKSTSKFCFCGRTFLFRPEIRQGPQPPVLGHFIVVHVHPIIMDGNGRIGRFLTHVMLRQADTGAGRPSIRKNVGQFNDPKSARAQLSHDRSNGKFLAMDSEKSMTNVTSGQGSSC